MNKTIIGAVVVLVVIIGLFMYMKRDKDMTGMDMDGTTSGQVTTPTPVASDLNAIGTGSTSPTSVVGTATVKEFTVESGNFFFKPNTMVVNKGDTVKITLKNSGGVHDLKIDAFKVATPRISGTDSTTVTFVADQSGSFEYYCSVGTHRQMGMVGTLTVK